MKLVHYNVKPRYTAGSPACVSRAIAEAQVVNERDAYERILEGVWGPEWQARAKREGLGPVREGENKCPNCCFRNEPDVTHCIACTWPLRHSINDGKHFSPVEEVTEHSNHWMVRCMLTGELFIRPFAWQEKKQRHCKRCQREKDRSISRAMEGSYS